MKEDANPLVSIIVVTYNSSSYVIETLDSIYEQTYSYIELIVSDDCSSDNTVCLCNLWIAKYKDRFVDSKVITVDRNTGISANMNRAEDECHGKFIKPIAGDDMLTPNCISDYIDFVKNHPLAYFCFGKVEIFDGNAERRVKAYHWINYDAFKLSSEEQLKMLMKTNFIAAASYFYNREMAIEFKIRNDESIPCLEDWPKWIMIINSGNKLYFMDKIVARYRMSDTSICSQDEYIGNPIFDRNISLFKLKYIVPYVYKKNHRRAWRLKQYCLQSIKPVWWRGILLRMYEFFAFSYRYFFRGVHYGPVKIDKSSLK